MKLGEIWDVNFSPQIGKKVIPVIIINHDSIGSLKPKVVIPITDGLKSVKEWHVELVPNSKNGLAKPSVADCFQIKSLSKDRFITKRGDLSVDEMDSVKLCLMKVLDLL